MPLHSSSMYMAGVRPWLDAHAGTLRSVHVCFLVRQCLPRIMLRVRCSQQSAQHFFRYHDSGSPAWCGVQRRRPRLLCGQPSYPVQALRTCFALPGSLAHARASAAI